MMWSFKAIGEGRPKTSAFNEFTNIIIALFPPLSLTLAFPLNKKGQRNMFEWLNNNLAREFLLVFPFWFFSDSSTWKDPEPNHLLGTLNKGVPGPLFRMSSTKYAWQGPGAVTAYWKYLTTTTFTLFKTFLWNFASLPQLLHSYTRNGHISRKNISWWWCLFAVNFRLIPCRLPSWLAKW